MKFILVLFFVVLTTVVHAYPLGEEFTDGERRERNVQLKDDADKLTAADDDYDDDASAAYADFAAAADNHDVARRAVGKSVVYLRDVRANCHCALLTA